MKRWLLCVAICLAPVRANTAAANYIDYETPQASQETSHRLHSSDDWNIRALITLIDERDRRYTELRADQKEAIHVAFDAQSTAMQAAFAAQGQAVTAAFSAQKEAVNAALAAADRAVTKAELAAEKRFEGLNEFRAALADQQRTLMPRAEVDVLMKALAGKQQDEVARLDRLEATGVGSGQTWMMMGIIASLVIASVSALAALRIAASKAHPGAK